MDQEVDIVLCMVHTCLFYLYKEKKGKKVEATRVRLQSRFFHAVTVSSTQKIHRVVPDTDGYVIVFDMSTSKTGRRVRVQYFNKKKKSNPNKTSPKKDASRK